MYKVWTASDSSVEALARGLEAHLNEFAGEVVSVSYAVADIHHVLAVYRDIELASGRAHEHAVAEAEMVIHDGEME